ncbi:dimethylsulfonioproprionate lyase family protein [Roseiarcus sp.]|uniref:dimethylsulfonioproprionate lyase family protein n=1 Tax=Roseiarcus sp. TaxID=1969460 RepID=UPI003C529E66
MSNDPEPPLYPMPDKTRIANSLRPLVAALLDLLEQAGPAASPFLHDWPRALIARPQAARTLPAVSALEGLSRFAAPQTRTLVEAVAALAGDLDWRQTYSSADFGEGFLQNYGWSEWIGKRGAFESDAIACGVLLLGRDTEYPAHSHEAEELYLPLAGHAWWRAAESGWLLRPPGQWIHHPSWTTHAMRTEGEPLLAAYVWRAGDLTAKSRIT